MNQIQPQDEYLVDRGFKVQHLLLKKKASIFIPPFRDNSGKLNKEAELQTRRIAKARIHVERFNERLKKFRLIDGVIIITMKKNESKCVI